MIKKKQVVGIVSITLVCFLVGTSMASDGNPWDRVWEAIYGLHVQIDTLYEDVQTLDNSVVELQSEVDTLEARVEELESQMLPKGYVCAPAYDSGWIQLDEYESVVLAHNLGTADLLVYLIGWNVDDQVHQLYYGGSRTAGGYQRGGKWFGLDSSHITLSRGFYGDHWESIRVMLWIIQEPLT